MLLCITVPIIDDATKMCVNSTSGGTGSVLRSASDTAIMTVAEAWELSLAAASASKDKRVKDVKNTSLKHQNSKKRQLKATNEPSVLSVTDGEYCLYLGFLLVLVAETVPLPVLFPLSNTKATRETDQNTQIFSSTCHNGSEELPTKPK